MPKKQGTPQAPATTERRLRVSIGFKKKRAVVQGPYDDDTEFRCTMVLLARSTVNGSSKMLDLGQDTVRAVRSALEPLNVSVELVDFRSQMHAKNGSVAEIEVPIAEFVSE